MEIIKKKVIYKGEEWIYSNLLHWHVLSTKENGLSDMGIYRGREQHREGVFFNKEELNARETN